MKSGNIPFWKESPFFRLTIPFIAGIILYRFFPGKAGIVLIIAAVCLSGFLALSLRRIAAKYRSGWMQGFLLTIIIVAAGFLHIHYHTPQKNPLWYGKRYAPRSNLMVMLTGPLSEKNNSYKAEGKVIGTVSMKRPRAASGKILLYFSKNNEVEKLGYGRIIRIKKPVQEIPVSGNPGGFDYKEYCRLKGIYDQVFLNKEDFTFMDIPRKYGLAGLLVDIRKKTVNILQENIPGRKESGLAEALLIGYRDDLDRDLLQSYSNTGVVHVIAISGLHLGLVYLLLSRAAAFLRIKNKWKKAILIITGIWAFSLIAGGNPSVLRSALMFSFIGLGECMIRKAPVINSLCASAFILLLTDPYMLWDTGFQLSYAAVLSIVIYMNPIYNLIFLENPVLDKIWKTAAASLSAQVLTVPVTLFYFHQFPVYFLLTNVLIIPVSGIVLLLEILLCCVSFSAFLSSAAGYLIQAIIRLMNSIVSYSEALPYSVLKNLEPDLIQCALLYVFIAGITCFLFYGRKCFLHISVYSLVVIFCLRLHSFYEASRQLTLVVYNIPRISAIDVYRGRQATCYFGAGIKNNPALYTRYMIPSLAKYRINQIRNVIMQSKQNVGIDLKYYSILILKDSPPHHLPNRGHKKWLVILSENVPVSIRQIKNLSPSAQIIIDASNSYSRTIAWIKACLKCHLPFYSVRSSGAFVMNLN